MNPKENDFRSRLSNGPSGGRTRMTANEFREFKAEKIQPTANDLTKAVVRFMQVSGWTFWRQNNVSVFDKKLGKHRAFVGMRGLSDAIGYRKGDGKFGAVEVKVGRDKLSPHQIEFLQGLLDAGGFAAVVRSLDELERKFEMWIKGELKKI